MNSLLKKDSIQKPISKYVDLINSTNAIKVKQTLHKLQIGDAIYLDSDGLYKKATLNTNFNVIGFVSSVVDDDSFEYKTYGKIVTDRYNFDKGHILYLSSTGDLVNTPEDITKPVGIQIENGFIINIQQAVTY